MRFVVVPEEKITVVFIFFTYNSVIMRSVCAWVFTVLALSVSVSSILKGKFLAVFSALAVFHFVAWNAPAPYA